MKKREQSLKYLVFICASLSEFLPWSGSQAFNYVDKQVELRKVICGENDSIGSRMDMEMPELCKGIFT